MADDGSPIEAAGNSSAADGTPPTAAEQRNARAFHELVHAWIPLAIVVMSVLAATMGWRASLSDETSDHDEELSRQNLVQQQQLVVQDNQAVDSDIQTFGQFAQYSELAQSLHRSAAGMPAALGNQMLAEAQADLGIARYLGRQIAYQDYAFDATDPTGNPALRSDGAYMPGHPYDAAAALARAENEDTALHGLAPEQLHARAESEHTRGVQLEGVGALFVAVLALMTIAALIPGPPKVWVSGGGFLIAIVALALFATVQLS